MELEDNDQIDALLEQTGFGPWAPSSGGAGAAFLHGGTALSVNESRAACMALGASHHTAPPTSIPGLLAPPGCAALIRHADERCSPGQSDQVRLSAQQLSNVAGRRAADALVARFGGAVDEIKIRRSQASGAAGPPLVVNFHTDHARRTMQVALNGEAEYGGGKLVYATANAGVHQPSRPAGSATVHDNTIAHGVTRMTWGVRYGLFLVLH